MGSSGTEWPLTPADRDRLVDELDSGLGAELVDYCARCGDDVDADGYCRTCGAITIGGELKTADARE
jgi:hypothetical protein